MHAATSDPNVIAVLPSPVVDIHKAVHNQIRHMALNKAKTFKRQSSFIR
jgi:hypothetical protein